MSFVKKIGLIVLGVCLALIFLESLLRLGGVLFFAKQNLINTLSLSEHGAYTILCVGESTTALGGPYSWPRQLETILTHQMKRKVAVINKGIPGGDSTAIIAQLEDNLNRFRPDMVIVMMGVNDRENSVPDNPAGGRAGTLSVPEMKTGKLIRQISTRLAAIFPGKIIPPAGDNLIPNPAYSENDYFSQGCGYVLKGEFDRAERSFKKVLELNPNNAGAYMSLGDCCDFKQEHGKAETMFQKALAIDPLNADIYVKLGWAYNGRKDFEKAEAMFKKAIDLAPENDLAYVRLGRCYCDSKRYEKAEAVYKQAIAANPQTSEAYCELGTLYMQRGEFEKAGGVFARALDSAPANTKAWGVLAVLNLENRHYPQSEACFARANRLMAARPNPVTERNYNKLKTMVRENNIRLVCVQYPLRDIQPLKTMLGSDGGIIFVDNEAAFKQAVKKDNYFTYFSDIFAGDFGHCTARGHKLLAENIAAALNKSFSR